MTKTRYSIAAKSSASILKISAESRVPASVKDNIRLNIMYSHHLTKLLRLAKFTALRMSSSSFLFANKFLEVRRRMGRGSR